MASDDATVASDDATMASDDATMASDDATMASDDATMASDKDRETGPVVVQPTRQVRDNANNEFS